MKIDMAFAINLDAYVMGTPFVLTFPVLGTFISIFSCRGIRVFDGKLYVRRKQLLRRAPFWLRR